MVRWSFAVLALVACNKDPPEKLAPWLEDWESMRRCLVGSDELGPDTATANAIAELTSGECGSTAKLRYPGLPDDRSGRVVSRWATATKLVEPLFSGTPRERGAAIDGIDAEVVELRKAADLPAVVRTTRKPIATLPAGQPLLVGGRPLAASDGDLEEMFLTGVITGSTDAFEFAAVSLDDVRTGPRTAGALAIPSRTWTAEDEGTGISVGPSGGPRTKIALPSDHYIMQAIDDGDTRIVLLQPADRGGPPYSLAVSTDAGKRWRVIAPPDGRSLGAVSRQDPITGAVEVVVRTAGYAYLHRWAPGSPWWLAATKPPPVVFPAEAPDLLVPWIDTYVFACHHSGVLWGVDGITALRMDSTALEELRLHGTAIGLGVDCRGDAMTVVRHHPDRVERCSPGACEVVHEARHRHLGHAALLDDGSWIYAAAIDDVVGVWREAKPAEFYRLAAPGELRAISVLRGIPYLVVVVDQEYRFVSLS